MILRRLERDEIERIWTIDRREIHENIYQMRDGAMVLTPYYFNIPGWRKGQIEAETPQLYSCFDRGGVFAGIFDEETLTGIAVVDCVLFGDARDTLELKKLYISRDYRRQGSGKRLFEAAQEIARARGAKFLYISATPTENTVNFYLQRGSRLANPPDPALLTLEPDDIHLVCAV